MKTKSLLSLLAFNAIAQAQTAPGPTVPAAPSSEAAPFFRDVPPTHWAYAAVQRLAAAGIIEGVPVAGTPQTVASTPAPKAVTAAVKPALPAVKFARVAPKKAARVAVAPTRSR